MTDTIFGLTQKVQQLQADIATVETVLAKDGTGLYELFFSDDRA